MVKNYTDKQLLDKVKSLPSFKGIPKDYWILAVRSDEDTFNVFDDKYYLFQGEKFILVGTCTTNPGGPSLLGGFKKYKQSGSAVIKSDEWYYDVYKYGLHNGRMPALRQVKPMKYFRDGNMDKKVDEVGQVIEGNFSTNFHFNSYNVFDGIKNAIQKFIGEWSHGCIVANEEDKYEQTINLTKNQPSVSLCLIKEF